MLNEALPQELHRILKEDYKKNLNKKELVEVADTLVGFFDLLAKIDAWNKANIKMKMKMKYGKPN